MNKFELETWKQNKTKNKKNTVTQVWIRKVASDVSIQQFQRCKKFASLNNLFVSLMDSYSTAIFGTSCKVILFREWWLKLLLNKSSSKNNAKEFEHFLRKVSSKHSRFCSCERPLCASFSPWNFDKTFCCSRDNIQ